MRFDNFFICSMCVVLACSAGCNSKKPVAAAGNAVATVNGAVLTEDDLYLALGEAHGARQSDAVRARALEELINEELLYQQGLALGLDRDAKYRDMVIVMEMRLRELKRAEIARRVTSTRISATVDVTYEDARRYYEQNEKNISTDLHLSILRFPDDVSADDADRRLHSGAQFVHMSGGAAEPENRTEPRDAGFLHWNQIPAEWEKAVYALEKGGISGVLRSPRTGICIVQLVDTRRNPDAGFDGMSASVMNRLRDLRLREAYERYILELRKNATIVQFGKGGKPLEK